MAKVFASVLVLLSLSFTFACSSSPSTTTTSPPNSNQTSSGGTFQSLANQGLSVFSGKCATCHGTGGQGTGQGPALWGSGFIVGKYSGATLFATNAQAMLSFISSTMPFNAPGTLSHTDAINVLCYLLVQENEVTPSASFDEGQLGNIPLK